MLLASEALSDSATLVPPAGKRLQPARSATLRADSTSKSFLDHSPHANFGFDFHFPPSAPRRPRCRGDGFAASFVAIQVAKDIIPRD
ncbi:hypothetical protein BDN71DRAFT_314018 [Pleurotus eryngii]|uniref:Uncharacterized protein n=1 Tax=Pleurotus eryngii TaxID=5323 RepID=A0A9P6A447_PLEER|nr:hypothetical protein BDN71DRAFT_314018 [Pleurotus eryngii]